MDAARWERIEALFHDAAGRPEAEWRAFLDSRCGNPGLVAEVLALLREDALRASLIDRGLGYAASRMVGDPVPGALPTGDFGPYRIRSGLGEGGMGTVYLAERTDLGGLVAIKVLRDASLSPARRARFVKEERTLAQLDHPSIARLYDADALPDGTPWFVMEYVEGAPLTDYCARGGCSIPVRLRLFRAVCDAVQHAHGHAVIHRDLKPSNILVKAGGEVKLLDFGIAKQLENLEGPEVQTRTALRLMTPAYAAPEQVRGERVGTHTDIYSLGVVLYEMLAGRLPFDLANRTPAAIERIITEEEPDRPSAAARKAADTAGSGAGFPGAGKASWADLDVLCLTAMHKEPARRYPTVEALVRDINHYLHGEPLEARPDRVSYRLGKFVRRHAGAVGAALLVFLGVVGLVAFYTVRLATARDRAVVEAARTGRIQRFMLDLFQGGDEAVGPADSLRVVTLVDGGVRQARRLDVEPAVQAELYQTLGSVFWKLGQFDRADTLLRAALDRHRALFGADHAQVASTLVALGRLRSSQAKFAEAERLIRDGLAMARRHLEDDEPAVAEAMTALGHVLTEGGKYDDAVGVLGEAVRLRAKGGVTTPELAASIRELVNTHFYAGRYAIADSLGQVALAVTVRLNGERHPLVAADLINLGAVQHDWGRYQNAERYFRRALDITDGFYGADHHKTASNLTMLGRSLVFQERFDEAGELLRRALAIQERVFGPVHPRVASALNDLGNIAIRTGRPAEAEPLFRRMIEIYRSVHGEEHYLIGIAVSNLAGVYMARNEYRRAEQLYRDAARRFTESQSADHLNTGIARIKLGGALLRQRRFAEAERELHAGYGIVSRQASPSVRWLQMAQEDLVTAYDALGRSVDAARFRAELADTGGPVPDSAGSR